MKSVRILAVIGCLCGASAWGQLIFPDGSEQGTAALTLNRVLVIPSDGSPSENGAGLLSALTEQAGSQSVDVILLEPGRYDVGGTTISLVEHVDVVGFGPDRTTISGTGSPVVNGADDVTLSGLQLQHDQPATALSIAGVQVKLRNIRIYGNVTSGTSFGLVVSGGGECELQDVEVFNSDAAVSGSYTAIRVTGENGAFGSYVEIGFGCDIGLEDASGGMKLIGLEVGDGSTASSEGAEAEVSGSYVEVEGGTASSAGIQVATDGILYLISASVGASQIEAAGSTDGVMNAGEMNALNTLFFGSVTGAGNSVFSQCTTVTGSGATPITDTNVAVSF